VIRRNTPSKNFIAMVNPLHDSSDLDWKEIILNVF
jgi:hypothetical protein